MFIVHRKLWFTLYALVWVVLGTVYAFDLSAWVLVPVSVGVLAFVGFTDPAPRNEPVPVGDECDCGRCGSAARWYDRRDRSAEDMS